MFQVRATSRKKVTTLTPLNFFQIPRRTLVSNNNSRYSNPFRNVLQRFTLKKISETQGVEGAKLTESSPLKKHTHQLKTELKAKRNPEVIPAEKTDLRTASEKTSHSGLFNNRDISKQSRLPTEVKAPPKVHISPIHFEVKPKDRIITKESRLSLAKNKVSAEEKVRIQNQVPAVRSLGFISIGRSTMKVLADPAKGTRSTRFVPLSQSIPQSQRKFRNNVMPHMPILPDRVPSQPVQVKVSGGYKIYLCQSKSQCDEAVVMLRNSVRNLANPYLGFDTESTRYRLGSQVSVIQLASKDICVIFQVGQIHQSTGKIPEALCKLLADPSILKAGVNATGDVAFLKKAHKLSCHGIVNIDSIAQKLGHKYLSLIELVHKFGIDMELDKAWRKKKWSRTHLTPQEVNYAANDAIASYRLFDALTKRSFITNAKD